jgi:hypothetical protein
MDEIFNTLKDFFAASPEYIYLIVGIVFLVLLIGAIKDKKWAIDPESTSQRMLYNTFGHEVFRILIGGAYLLGTLSGFGGFVMYLTYF